MRKKLLKRYFGKFKTCIKKKKARKREGKYK